MLDPHPDRGRRHAAAHPGPGRRQPLPLGARRRRAGAGVVEAYIRALASQISVPSGLGADDRFDIIIEHRRAATGETETGQLLYAGLDRARGRDLQLMQWAQRRPRAMVRGVRRRPRRAAACSSRCRAASPPISACGCTRSSAIRGCTAASTSAPRYGTPILAAADGRVTGAGWAGGYGRQVRLSHAGGLATSYSHMSRIAVSRGARVRQGQVIGYVGSTGLSTGPHLHYEMYRNGATINPRSVALHQPRASWPAASWPSFRSRLRSLLGTPVGARRSSAAGAAAAASGADADAATPLAVIPRKRDPLLLTDRRAGFQLRGNDDLGSVGA